MPLVASMNGKSELQRRPRVAEQRASASGSTYGDTAAGFRARRSRGRFALIWLYDAKRQRPVKPLRPLLRAILTPR